MDGQSGAERCFPVFAVTVDVVALMIRGRAALGPARRARRGALQGTGGASPAASCAAGRSTPDESLDDAARREFAEETGIELEAAYLTQLGAYGDPGRDPRGNVVTVAYLAVAPTSSRPQRRRRRAGTPAGCT